MQHTNNSGESDKMELNIADWLPNDFTTVENAYRYVVASGRENAIYLKANINELIKRYSREFENVDWLSTTGLVYVTLLVIIVTTLFVSTVNLYRKIRYAIPARVNCWFCNTNTKVLYSLRDTWTCPTCQQYNGFTPDGHYNKRIPAQFMEALNRPGRGGPAQGYNPKQNGSNSNGLCSQCNLNQVLKVFQLASFGPVNERNFDAEIEAEQKRLEDLYDICSQCKQTVQKRLMTAPTFHGMSGGQTTGKVKINRVTPTLPSRRQENDYVDNSPNRYESDLAKLHEELQRNTSDSSDSSQNTFLSLNNLNIGSRNRKNHKKQDSSPHGSSMTPLLPPSSPLYCRDQVRYLSHQQISQDSPIWKDYPLVQGRISPTYSIVDSMSVPVGQSAYPSSFSSAQSQFNYQSSNLGGVFGGRKPLISPPKFSNSNTPSFAPHLRYGPYYEVAPMHVPMTPSTVIYTPFANPISRSSSQSSGFVSQHGSPPPPMPPQSPVQMSSTNRCYSPAGQ